MQMTGREYIMQGLAEEEPNLSLDRPWYELGVTLPRRDVETNEELLTFRVPCAPCNDIDDSRRFNIADITIADGTLVQMCLVRATIRSIDGQFEEFDVFVGWCKKCGAVAIVFRDEPPEHITVVSQS